MTVTLFIPMMTAEMFMYCVHYILNCWKCQGSLGNLWKLLFLSLWEVQALYFSIKFIYSLLVHSYSFFLETLDLLFCTSVYKLIIYCAISSWLLLLKPSLEPVWVQLGLLAFIQHQGFDGCGVALWRRHSDILALWTAAEWPIPGNAAQESSSCF